MYIKGLSIEQNNENYKLVNAMQNGEVKRFNYTCWIYRANANDTSINCLLYNFIGAQELPDNDISYLELERIYRNENAKLWARARELTRIAVETFIYADAEDAEEVSCEMEDIIAEVYDNE